MYKSKLKNLSIIVITIILTFGFSISLQSLLASWTAPTAEAPANNTETPINVGNAGQSKNSGLILNAGSISENGLIVQSGNVGIGTDDPKTNLDLGANQIKLASSDTSCNNLTSGAIRYNSTDKKTEFCDGTSWYSVVTAAPVVQIKLLDGVHTAQDCTDKNGGLFNVGPIGATSTNYICKIRLTTTITSCPTGWTQYPGWYSTKSGSCSDTSPAGCGSCTTIFRSFDKNPPIDTCNYNTGQMYYYSCEGNCEAWTCGGGGTCYAKIDEIACK